MGEEKQVAQEVGVAFSEEEKEGFLRALEAKLPALFPALAGFTRAQIVMVCSWLLASCFAFSPEAHEAHEALLIHFQPMVDEALEAMAKRDPAGMAAAIEQDLVLLPYPEAPRSKVVDFADWRRAHGKPS